MAIRLTSCLCLCLFVTLALASTETAILHKTEYSPSSSLSSSPQRTSLLQHLVKQPRRLFSPFLNRHNTPHLRAALPTDKEYATEGSHIDFREILKSSLSTIEPKDIITTPPKPPSSSNENDSDNLFEPELFPKTPIIPEYLLAPPTEQAFVNVQTTLDSILNDASRLELLQNEIYNEMETVHRLAYSYVNNLKQSRRRTKDTPDLYDNYQKLDQLVSHGVSETLITSKLLLKQFRSISETIRQILFSCDAYVQLPPDVKEEFESTERMIDIGFRVNLLSFMLDVRQSRDIVTESIEYGEKNWGVLRELDSLFAAQKSMVTFMYDLTQNIAYLDCMVRRVQDSLPIVTCRKNLDNVEEGDAVVLGRDALLCPV